uniref:Uncharacterized protein n=1 Tax=Takifugu rubripes TaxID=31033 RepID=A0A3B5KIH2_TAKRU
TVMASELEAKGSDSVVVNSEMFFSLISQRGRMDEQRCSLNVTPMSSPINKPNQKDLLQVLVNSQSRRLDDQRVTLPSLPGIGNRIHNPTNNKVNCQDMESDHLTIPWPSLL